MRLLPFPFIPLLYCLLLASCASVTERSLSGSSQGLNSEGRVIEHLEILDVEMPLQVGDVWKKSEQDLEELTQQALLLGADAIDYLATHFYLHASYASSRGQVQKAVRLYPHLLTLSPGEDMVLRKYAIELIRLGRLEKAQDIVLQIYQAQEKKGEFDENIGLILAGIYVALDDSQKAQQIYLSVIENNKTNQEACVFLAKSYARAEDYQNADQVLAACQKNSDPKNSIFSYYRATIAQQAGDDEKAKIYFKEAYTLDPDFFQAVMALGRIYESQENWEQAIAVYQDFIAKFNQTNRAVLSRLVDLLFVHQSAKDVLPYAKTLMHLEPNNLNLKVRVGIIYSDLKEYDRAIEVFKEILEEIPKADRVLYYVAALYQQQGKFDQAISYFSRIPEQSTLFHESILEITRILSAQAMGVTLDLMEGRAPAAEQSEALNRLVEFTQRHSKGAAPEVALELNIILADYYETVGEYQKAARTIEGISTVPGFSTSYRYYWGVLLYKAGKIEKSIQVVEEILQTEPDHAHALNFIGYTMLEHDMDLQQAHRYIKRAVELAPEDGHIRDSLGWYYYKRGEFKKALVEIKKAMELLDYPDMIVTKHLAIIYKEMKEYAKALKVFEQAMELARWQEEKQAIQEYIDKITPKRLPAQEE